MTWSDPAYEGIARILGQRTGLAFQPGRRADAEAAIGRAMARAGVAEGAVYLEGLRAGRLGMDDLIAEITVGETYFFRDPRHFELLRREILPALAQRRPADHVFRLWSAGCASGEEPYSLAILADEMGWGSRVHVLGTDISRAALARAAAGRYGAWSLRGVDPATIQRWFSLEDGRQVLDPRIRARAQLELLNLAIDPYPSFATGTWRMDVILCRNVLIYFDRDTIRAVTARLAASLAPDGWLIPGPSDPIMDGEGLLEMVTLPEGIFYRRAGEAARPRPVPVPLPVEVPVETPEPSTRAEVEPEVEAEAAFAAGDYGRVVELCRDLATPEGAALCVRAIANSDDAAVAERTAVEATRRHPLSAELHLLHAALLVGQGRNDVAASAARRAVYLDRGLGFGHFLLGTALAAQGDREAAARAFRNARDLCARLPAGATVPFSDGQRAGRLAEAAAAALEAWA